ncbi:sister chromatid cohesion 1 protein 4-like isoform X1 [Triticum dicoccoides]|uniref:sister chromatid cohesion 1 protein 4-like isoform X1 n=1 Tax=Triticum dicoccoides TaxID=85692 RepID=UPI00188E3149|nr:sister chromatid cohesion 1 protein 4-like isoform X1 [Triticum dicoccoides]
MFYSKTMLSKKGPLGAVWVAGVRGVAALTRDQVLRTDVASSVDKILPDVETTYRILGLLLLGVVRIYSKKVEYLCYDSNQFFESTVRGKKVLKRGKKGACARRLVLDQEDTRRAKRVAVVQVPGLDEPADLPPIFTVPKRFELDSFDLQIPEDREDDNDDHHQLPRQDTLLEDEHQRMPNFYESYQGMPYADLDSAYVVPVCIIPAEMISVADEVTDLLYLSNIGDELENESQNADPACFTPVKDVLPPEAMDMMAEVSELPEKSKEVKEARREVNGEENGDPSCSTPLPENQEMQRPVNAVENVVSADLDENHPVVEESENGLAVGKPNTTLSVEIPDIEEQESLEPSTPEPLREGASEKFGVATPAQNEKRQVTRKRRRGLYNKRKVWVLWDENVVLDNDTMREIVDGVGVEDLVVKRRKAPHTRHQIWRESRFRSLQDTFMEPILQCDNIEPILQYSTTVRLNSTTADASCGESVKAKKCLSYEPAESNNPHKEAANEETECVPDELTNGIHTPIGCYNQSQQSQDVCECNDDTPYEKNSTLVNGEESGLPEERLYESTSHSALRNESLTADIDADIPMDEENAARDEDFPLSTRTRAVAKCLHQLFLDQKSQQQSNVPVTLGQALEGSKRKTTARFFYETLILKSRGLIDVNQEKPYENITISATPQLDAVLQNPVPPSTS